MSRLSSEPDVFSEDPNHFRSLELDRPNSMNSLNEVICPNSIQPITPTTDDFFQRCLETWPMINLSLTL